MKFSPLINAEELLKAENQNLFLADVRTGPSSRSAYETSHLAGAVFFDLETDLADKKNDAADGGRHPLPPIHDFCQTIANSGIGPDTFVVIYDDKNGANAAARFWWMLKAVGHEKVAVLNGGMQAAIESGYPVDDKIPVKIKADYPCKKEWGLPIIDISGAEQITNDPSGMLIDVRETKRFIGETEPIDLVAGHIPGAYNLPFANNLDDNGKFLDPGILKQYYLNFIGNKPIANVAIHCGSGVTACHTILGMAYAGLDIPALYVGSWSEWSRSGKGIGTGE